MIALGVPFELVVLVRALAVQFLVLVDLDLLELIAFEVVEDPDLVVASVADSDVLGFLVARGVDVRLVELEVDVLDRGFEGAIGAEVEAADVAAVPLLEEGELFAAARVCALLGLEVG